MALREVALHGKLMVEKLAATSLAKTAVCPSLTRCLTALAPKLWNLIFNYLITEAALLTRYIDNLRQNDWRKAQFPERLSINAFINGAVVFVPGQSR